MQIKFWAIRFVLGVVLGFGAGFVVEVLHIGFVVLIFGSLDDFLNRKHPREEMWLLDLGTCTLFGATSGTALASFLGVMMAPKHYADRLIWRSWAMAATLGAIEGGVIGGVISLLHPQYISLDWMMILTVSLGPLAGAAAALVLRLRVNR